MPIDVNKLYEKMESRTLTGLVGATRKLKAKRQANPRRRATAQPVRRGGAVAAAADRR